VGADHRSSWRAGAAGWAWRRGATSGILARLREHRYTLEFPHPPARVWALMQDYARWCEYAPMVRRVEVLHPGDACGNGLLRRVLYRLPFGRTGAALELVTDVVPEHGYTYTMLSRTPGSDQTGSVRLEPLPGGRTRLHFEERYHLTSLPWRWLEGPIYRFINRQNEASMRALSDWLVAHPEYRADLA
jgi:hypothetical protein